VSACSSGGSTGDPTDGDVDQTDTVDSDESDGDAVEAETELEDTDKDEVDGDSEEGVETDGDADGDAEETDEEPEAEEPGLPIPFTAFTSGGGSVSSENYVLKLFVAPVQPTGSASGSQYKIKLGPGGLQQ